MLGEAKMAGELGIRVIRAKKAPLSWRIKNILRWMYLKGWFAHSVVRPIANFFGLATMIGKLEARLIKKDGEVINYGTLGYRVATTAFVNFMVDQLQAETSEWGDFKYHDSGIGTTNEAVGDTDIETSDEEDRVAGTQTEDDADDYQSVGTISYTTTKAITEHGLFSQSTGTTLMDRTEFSAINVENGDSIQFTYTLNCAAGS